MEKKAEAWQMYNQAAIIQQLIEALPRGGRGDRRSRWPRRTASWSSTVAATAQGVQDHGRRDQHRGPSAGDDRGADRGEPDGCAQVAAGDWVGMASRREDRPRSSVTAC